MRQAKIIATIGPASESREGLDQLMESGMDVARLNFSHGSHDDHERVIRRIRDLSTKRGRSVAILQDLAGVKIRTGRLRNHEPVTLKEKQLLSITSEDIVGDASRFSTTYPQLPDELEKGDAILVSDGQIELEVLETQGELIRCRVIVGGKLGEHQGMNIPDKTLRAPSLTEKDLTDLDFGIEHEVDFVGLSFVRSQDDVSRLREAMQERDADIPIIAKLETPSSIQNVDEILAVSDGVMIARGDLGVEVAPEKVPVIQKRIIAEANRAGKIVITATQMLDSMIRNPRPTRAEASDVANAVLDGSDAVMLSGETAIGRHPTRAVQMMDRIIREAESLEVQATYRTIAEESHLEFPEAVCNSAYHAAKAIHARYIVAFTQSGSTARVISKFRPRAEIIGVTPHAGIMRRLTMFWGVRPMMMRLIDNVDELILATEELLRREGLVATDDRLVILTGAPIVEKGHTSLMKLHRVGSRS